MGTLAGLTGSLLLLASPARAAVSGRVVDPDGKAVAGAFVSAYAPETPDERAARLSAARPRPALASVRAADDGTFRLEAGAPVLVLEARAPGFAPATATSIAGAAVTIEARRAALLRGTITGGGRPLAGARVAWLRDDAEWTAVTAADGSYEAPEPRAWASQVLVLHPDYAPDEAFGAPDSSRSGDRALDPGVAVEGVLRDEAGRPVSGAAVWAGTWARWPMATTRADGTFRIAHASRDWREVRARTDALVGSARRRAGRAAVVMRPGRSLGGFVRDPAGRPLAGATVRANAERAGLAAALTDAAGRYLLSGLAGGRYSVAAALPGYEAASTAVPPEVDLRGAMQARQDLVLQALPVLRGTVRDEERRPVEGALVTLGFRATPHIYAAHPFAGLGADGEVTRTAADGSFSLTVSSPAHEEQELLKDRPLIVLAPGFAAARVPLGDLRAARPPLAVTLARGIELAGRVVTPEGLALGGVRVVLAEEGSLAGTMVPVHFVLAAMTDEAWVVTSADGRFAVRVHPALHTLSFRAPGRAPRIVRGHDPRGPEPLQVVLEPAAFVRGHVLRADGRGVADVLVSLERAPALEPLTATTAADGAFAITDLAAGVYVLKAVQPQLGIDLARDVEAPAADVALVLDPAGTLRVRAVDAATRRPVAAYRLVVGLPLGRGARSVEVEDALGTVTVDDVPPGEASLTVTAEGHAPRQMDGVTVAAGETAAVEVALDREVVVRGKVTGDGAPLAEATVRGMAGEGSQSAADTTGEDGEYELRGLAAGELTLAFRAQGFLPEKRTLDSTQSSRVDVALRRGLALAGTVSSDGAPVAGATVSASSSAAGAGSYFARSDERGAFRLEGLAPGRYSVTAVADGKGRTDVEDVDAETASPLRLVLSRVRTAVLTGKLAGLPAEEGMMAIVVASGEEPTATATALVDSSLAFRMEDAPAGHVSVVAQAMSMSNDVTRTSRKVELTLAPGAEAETLLEFSPDVVSGVVTRAGLAVPGATVSFASRAGGGSGRTDARGAYQVFGLEAGRYQVDVKADGTSFATEYMASGSGEFDIAITGAAVHGRIVRADSGQPLREVEVVFWRLGAGQNRPAVAETSNERGEFTARGLREGRYRLTTSRAGFGQEVREVEVERGASAEVQIELSPADGITVAVVDARDGRPLDATVVVRDAARRVVANRHSGVAEDGTLNIPLADGSYLLSTSASGYGTVTLPVRSPARGLRVGLAVGGTLVIESGRDLRGRVRLIQPDGDEYVQCWCNGIADIQVAGRRATVEHVTAGSYTLELLDGDEVAGRWPVTIHDAQTATVAID